jgi:flagellar biosynthesis regulator FlbT
VTFLLNVEMMYAKGLTFPNLCIYFIVEVMLDGANGFQRRRAV